MIHIPRSLPNVIPGRSEAEGKGIQQVCTAILDPLPGPAGRRG